MTNSTSTTVRPTKLPTVPNSDQNESGFSITSTVVIFWVLFSCFIFCVIFLRYRSKRILNSRVIETHNRIERENQLSTVDQRMNNDDLPSYTDLAINESFRQQFSVSIEDEPSPIEDFRRLPKKLDNKDVPGVPPPPYQVSLAKK